ncbi:unnamed protein product [Rhizopus microsporus]
MIQAAYMNAFEQGFYHQPHEILLSSGQINAIKKLYAIAFKPTFNFHVYLTTDVHQRKLFRVMSLLKQLTSGESRSVLSMHNS